MNGINTTLDKGGNGSSKAAQLSVAITYSELLALRNSGTLTPGTWYRITDYTCTTTQDETQSAGHVFDIIVRADDASHLNENAYAAHHEGDTYFQDCKLEAWELKYCIDNDNTRFAWADEDGKGVIFFMKDEWNNQCPYDFKNIMFKRPLIDGQYDEDGENTWVYTFNVSEEEFQIDATIVDWASVEADYIPKSVFGNSIGECQISMYIDDIPMVQFILNNNVFLSGIIGSQYQNCNSNTLGKNCYNNTIGMNCFSNTFADNCYNNKFGNNCQHNTFGNDCGFNTFGNGCSSNTFGNGCGDNTFGNYFWSNTFGNSCSNNTFGNNCQSNTFGNSCGSNTFGNDCQSNTFGNNCQRNTFGNNIQYITVFENVRYCNVTGVTSGSYVQNAQILNGTQGTNVNKLTINFATGKNYTQVAGKNTSGTLKIFNPADNA